MCVSFVCFNDTVAASLVPSIGKTIRVHHVCCVCVEWQSFAVRCSVADESTEDGVWSSRDQEWSTAIRNTSQAYLEWERTGTPSSQHIAEPPGVSSWQS